jgi:hypothetical protein
VKKTENKTPSEDTNQDFSRLEKGGLNYVKQQRNYLIVSILYPVFSLVVQLVTLVLNNYLRSLPPDHRPPEFLFIDVLSPAIILFVISAFFLLNAAFLIRWKIYLDLYERLSKEGSAEPASPVDADAADKDLSSSASLTRLFYKIIKNMSTIKMLFFVLNFFLAYDFIWFISFFFFRVTAGSFPPKSSPLPPASFSLVQFLNILNEISMGFYLAYEWKHFYRWNKKLTLLKELEKTVNEEIGL